MIYILEILFERLNAYQVMWLFVFFDLPVGTKKEIKEALSSGKLAKINFCSTDKSGIKCAEIVEKELYGDVRGTLANKNEKPTGNCVICNKPATKVVYIGRSY